MKGNFFSDKKSQKFLIINVIEIINDLLDLKLTLSCNKKLAFMRKKIYVSGKTLEYLKNECKYVKLFGE